MPRKPPPEMLPEGSTKTANHQHKNDLFHIKEPLFKKIITRLMHGNMKNIRAISLLVNNIFHLRFQGNGIWGIFLKDPSGFIGNWRHG